MIDLSGKTAVVTGGSRGIGRAIALRLAVQGADVCISYRGNAAAAEETVSEMTAMGRTALAVQADVAQMDAAKELIGAAIAELGRVDILVNNAGITRDDLIMRMKPEDWNDVIDTNLSGTFWTIKAATRPMMKARSGRIINITSVSGQAGQMGQANYSSAKAGLIGLTKATARELASRGITCNAVAPGFVMTELTQDLDPKLLDAIKAQTPLARFGAPEEIADAVAFLASDEAAYITGQVLAVDGGLVMM
ncbi:MAG: 3-oxoacyl-[acyl-carrier-protein] reductase [Chloroflexota bacterium]|nr:3-oxoacyl-[acyl-carrier-protein] reductase [Chloroflexota bacterium]